MHFVAMLGMRLPVAFYYDALTTLISALVAILMAGIALLILHFPARSPRTITTAGIVVGLGIPLMHYIGMSGIRLCLPVYSATGLALAVSVSLALGIGSVWVIYGARRHRNILLGTVALGTSVVVVHFIAMAGTGFLPDESPGGSGPRLDNATLAMVVTLVAFGLCGAFLLTGVTFFAETAPEAMGNETPQSSTNEQSGEVVPISAPGQRVPDRGRIPYETEGRIHFVDSATVAALRAEGHYTLAYTGGRKLFCPWSITEAESRLAPAGFVRAHRSYLVNPSLVTGFERRKDNGVCLFDTTDALGKVPVSRARLGAVRSALGL
jgi:NO-binding membrane sensor protein with MHYT domain